MTINTKTIQFQIPEKYFNLIGAHTKLTTKFVIIEGKIIKEGEKVYFVNGEKEELWKVIPYKLLGDGDNLGICILCPGVTMVVKGTIIKKVIQSEKQKKTIYLWQGPGEIAVNVNSLLEKLAPFLPGEAKVEIIIWK